MSTDTEPRKQPGFAIRLPYFPWPSALGGLLLAAYYLSLNDPTLQAFYGLPPVLFQPPWPSLVATGFGLLLLIDMRRFQHRRRRQQQKLQQLKAQLDDLWQRNHQLQLKAHTYAGHADKLKLFISDKLLEYIEYDEKFLHFKGIAAEVRHNGVISFDKVQTALETARQETEEPRSKTRFVEAQDAMRYLWDLLDLSTADNLSLHIGNHLCECEEHYCQQLLEAEADNPPPFDPLCDPRRAVWRALALIQPELPPLPEEAEEYRIQDDSWHIQLQTVSQLLGKENHLVLMLDNLIKNAQFFSRKVSTRAGMPPLSLSLTEQQGSVRFRLYNRGPHIDEADREQLFQLGFSTRRTRSHHGRGLGLYFVNEIVKGYEGRILVNNIHPAEGSYLLELELADGHRASIQVEVALRDGRIHCRPSQNDSRVTSDEHPTAARCRWTLPAPLKRAWLRHQDQVRPIELADFDRKGKQTRMDPEHPDQPHWQFGYQPGRRDPSISFEALDIRGVQFEIRLPTPQSRLDSTEPTLDEAIDADVEALDRQFRPPG